MTDSGDDCDKEQQENLEAPQDDSQNSGAADDVAPLGEDPLVVQLQKELEESQEELARARAETYNVNQEYGNYVRRAKADALARRTEGQQDVFEALMTVLDDIEAARTAGELVEGPFASIANKLEEILSTRFGLERFGAAGDTFDPEVHDALMAQTNDEVTHPVVGQILQPGYRVKDRVLRPTKVLVDNPS